MMNARIRLFALAVFAAVLGGAALGLPVMAQQKGDTRDEFFWLGQINKATAVINTDEGMLDKAIAPKIAAGVAKVIEDGSRPGGERPSTVIKFEPLLIKAAGPEVTLLHAGRSSQDMHATYRAAILREGVLTLAEQLNKASKSLVKLAERHTKTIVPNYTNGVAAQPNSYAHYLLGHAAGLERDAQRLREAYARIDRCAMGTTVLNGTSWPLNRARMADYLGFAAIVDNAYDASQISSVDQPSILQIALLAMTNLSVFGSTTRIPSIALSNTVFKVFSDDRKVSSASCRARASLSSCTIFCSSFFTSRSVWSLSTSSS